MAFVTSTTTQRQALPPLQQWLLKVLPTVASLVVGSASFALSYVALRDEAAKVGAVPGYLAFLVPVIVDGGVICGSAVIWATAYAGLRRSWFPFLFVAALMAVSVVVNVAHASANLLARSIAALPPLVLLGTLELVATQYRRSDWPPATSAEVGTQGSGYRAAGPQGTGRAQPEPVQAPWSPQRADGPLAGGQPVAGPSGRPLPAGSQAYQVGPSEMPGTQELRSPGVGPGTAGALDEPTGLPPGLAGSQGGAAEPLLPALRARSSTDGPALEMIGDSSQPASRPRAQRPAAGARTRATSAQVPEIGQRPSRQGTPGPLGTKAPAARTAALRSTSTSARTTRRPRVTADAPAQESPRPEASGTGTSTGGS